MKKNTYFIVLLVFICSCKHNIKIDKDSDICKDDREKIGVIKNGIYKCFLNENSDYFKQILSKSFTPQQALVFDTIVHTFVISNKYRIENFVDYLIYNPNNESVTHLHDDRFNVTYTIPLYSSYNYLSLFVFTDIHLKIKWLISCEFAKENGIWKIINFYVGKYSYDNMNFRQYEMHVRQLERKVSITTTTLNAEVGKDLNNPSPFFRYEDKEIIDSYYEGLFNKAKSSYKLPIVNNFIYGPVEIFAIKAECTQGRYFPMIFYKTNIPIGDVENLNKQNDDLNSKIETLFPGIGKIADTIFYKVTNSDPLHNYEGTNYGFIKQLK